VHAFPSLHLVTPDFDQDQGVMVEGKALISVRMAGCARPGRAPGTWCARMFSVISISVISIKIISI
jgi:hypothetical protein